MSAITPAEFGLITSTRTYRTTCIPHWTTRRHSRSFAAFDQMTSAITPTEFGLTASTRTMQIVLPVRSRTNPSTKPDPLEPGEKPMEDPQFAGTNCLLLFRAKENRFACRWTRHQTCSPRTNPPNTPHEELLVALGNHRRLIPVTAPPKEQMSVERWRSTHLPNLKGKNRCHDAIRVPRTAGKMQKRA